MTQSANAKLSEEFPLETQISGNAYPPSEIETVACPVCKETSSKMLQQFPPFGVVKCSACELTYLSPRLKEPAMMAIYAADTYFEGGESYGSYETQEKSLAATFKRMFGVLNSRGYCKGALLDVGCGYGYLLAQAKGLFREYYGQEFSQRAADASRAYAKDVYTSPVGELPADKKYSLITAIQVIEHVYAPDEFVAQLVERLENGGSLLLATPDIGSFWYPLFGSRWPSFKLPEHVLYFDRKSLTALLTRHGLKNIEEIPYPHAFPLSVVLKKFGLGLPKFIPDINFWLPKTTIALIGRK